MTAPQTLQVIPAAAYAGDIPAPLAWHWVQTGEAVLIDVRTDAERAWVGQVPGAVPVQWKLWPGMANNPDFDAQLQAAVPAGGKAVLLCRSGVRSVAAAAPSRVSSRACMDWRWGLITCSMWWIVMP